MGITVFAVLGLLAATAGSRLVHASASVAAYGGRGGYRGGETDYTERAYGSTHRSFRVGDYDDERYDYTTNSEQFRSQQDDYEYPTSSGYPEYWDLADGFSLQPDDDYELQKSHKKHKPPPPPADAPSPPRSPPGQATGNPIDDCWRHDPNWFNNRQALARCGVGFGKNAVGGADGPLYIVTDNSDEDLVNPKEGTLRYGVLRNGPLWIVFDKNMTIQLKNELIVTSYKTIDGRGYDIHISGGAGLTIQYVSNVIVHGVHIHDLRAMGPAVIRSNSSHFGHRQGSDGDAINIFGSRDVWVDHCYFARGPDGLVDAVMGSTFVSVTNNFFEHHDKVMLFGAHPTDTMDNDMQVSVAFNYFAPGLIERVPRIRHGYVHIFNNYYASWGQYAVGGSEAPTILSEGNVFKAPDTSSKQVTKRIDDGDPSYSTSMDWDWHSIGDKFMNGAFFVSKGDAPNSAVFAKASSSDKVGPADSVLDITQNAGPLLCPPSGSKC